MIKGKAVIILSCHYSRLTLGGSFDEMTVGLSRHIEPVSVFRMAGAVYHWQLTYEPPGGAAEQIPIQAMVTGPELSLQTMNHIIFNALVPDILVQFPIRTYRDPPHTIVIDYAPQSEMLQGLQITLAGHGAGKNIFNQN